jgi:ornithine cyclodeaminase
MKIPHTLLWISDEQVSEVLTHKMARKAVEAALVAHARGEVEQPLKIYLRPGGRSEEYEHGRAIAMPASIKTQIMGMKWITGMPKNVERGLPRASAVVILNCVETGVPLAIIEGATLSHRRTGAVAAAAYSRLGVPDSVVALVGTGPVNREVILALLALGEPIREIRIFDRNPVCGESFLRRMSPLVECAMTLSPNLETCLRGASNVITATTGSKGYIDPEWVKEAKFFLPLSLDDFKAETLLSADKIVVDDFAQCNREEKLFHQLVRDGRLGKERIYAELGEIVAGTKAGRVSSEKIYCNLMGMAVEDIAVAKAIFDLISER